MQQICRRNKCKMEKFALKWNDFQSNVSKSIQNLRNREDFSDVTLVGDDFKQIAAHKIILSSCSEYFNNILKNIVNQKHPVLCLEGMSFQDIEKVLDYIYNGELKIYQEDIDHFLNLGQRLGLEGLIGQTESPKESSLNEKDNVVQDLKHFDDQSCGDEMIVMMNDEEKSDMTVIKRINNTTKDEGFLARTHDQTMTMAMLSFADGSSIESIEELNKKVEESYSKDNIFGYICLYCQKAFKHSGHIREHVEIHFEGLSMKCNYCENTFRSRNYFRQHVKRHRF